LDLSSFGIVRQADPHTNVPERARQDIGTYTVVAGDTVYGIAEKYGLQPETIFAANYYVLLDDPHNLQPGQKLNILPVDGVYREWQAGEGLNGVAKFYEVRPEDIVNYPLNHLDPATIGDYTHPNIKPGTWIIVPGGKYQYHAPGSVTFGITRTNPASAQVWGPGYCDPVTGGAIGTGTFVWPANKHYLSGFDYTPKINHLGIDVAGNLGEGVYATDGGVVVYAGWNNYGYGNMIMIDHGTGFQSLYAHLSEIYVGCGQSVNQGQAIGAIGSTGHSSGAHLHFEIRTMSNPVNPHDLLPAP
jgi:murein DD-endopeptidase MepM/ murein hydrolase activator NlpD